MSVGRWIDYYIGKKNLPNLGPFCENTASKNFEGGLFFAEREMVLDLNFLFISNPDYPYELY